ncbi:MAG: FmdB family transcriptional regulator [Actinobacteria bacterium]|nr:MAG: FmdB family transcriptional regulator [Actinomycetota bacterium]
MPIYEYRCERGHTFEVMQKMTDDPLSSCTSCSAPVQRVFHPVAVHFKGKGFYNTDYGTRSRQRELAQSAEGGSNGADKSGDGKSEAGSADAKGAAKSDGAAAKKSDSAVKKSDSKAS